MKNEMGISFYLRSSTIHIHQHTLNGLNNPLFIGFMINNDYKTLAVIPREKKDFYSVRLRADRTKRKNIAEVRSQKICLLLMRMNGWNPHSSYRVYGRLFSQQKIVVFDFSSAEVICENNIKAYNLNMLSSI